MKYAIYGLLLLLYVLHTDLWYWNDPRIVLGLPIGITYHLAWTVVVAAAFGAAVRFAWPTELEAAPTGVDVDSSEPAGR